MSTRMTKHFQRNFAHECHAHAQVVASLETVPLDRRDSAEYRKAVALLAHMGIARVAWFERLGTGRSTVSNLFPDQMSLDEVASRWTEAARVWMSYLDTLTDVDLDRVVEYQSLDADRFQNRVEEILSQLETHAPYHRGQIATLVRHAGGTPALTDLIYWLRQPISAS